MVNKKWLTVLLHIIGCIIFLALPVFLAPDFPRSLNIFNSRPTQRDLFAYALMVCFFYLNFFVLIPRFYFTKKYFIFFCIVLVCFFIISFVPISFFSENGRQMPQNNERQMQPPPPKNKMGKLPHSG